jgi:predicted TPR repeat methyltransferase
MPRVTAARICPTSGLQQKDMDMAWGFSSGNLIVDRRLGFAEGLAQDGDLTAAIDLLAEAMTLVPDWAAGWFRLGEWHAEAGAQDKAARAFDRAVAADPGDALGAGLKRDLARRVPLVEAMPPAFVEALFDQYAAGFETALVERLDYRAPDLLRAALSGRRYGWMMDLGCGTGLAGVAFSDLCDRIDGCDISAGMLAQAAEKGVYQRLQKADLAALEVGADRYDLVIAADVFVYLGALERIIGWCAGVLAEDGVLAFTVEAGDAPLTLRESRRFAHSRAYVEAVLTAAGFWQVGMSRVALRKDRGAVIDGYVVVARMARVTDRQDDGEGLALA